MDSQISKIKKQFTENKLKNMGANTSGVSKYSSASKKDYYNQRAGTAVAMGEHLFFKNYALRVLEDSKLKNSRMEKSSKDDAYKFKPDISSSQKSYCFRNPKFANTEKKPKKKYEFTTQELKEQEDLAEIEKNKPKKKLKASEVKKLTDKLYEEKDKIEIDKRALEKDVVEKTCPFAPKINDKEKPSVKNFYARLQSWITSQDEKINTLMANTCLFDSKTGQSLYSPNINPTESKRENIFEYLYNDGFNKKCQQTATQDLELKRILDEVNSKKMNEASEKMVSKSKSDAIDHLFEFFDEEGAGSIKYSEKLEKKLNKEFSEKFVKSLNDLMKVLKEKNDSINKEQFSFIISKLIDEMIVSDKNELLAWSAKQKSENAVDESKDNANSSKKATISKKGQKRKQEKLESEEEFEVEEEEKNSPKKDTQLRSKPKADQSKSTIKKKKNKD